jgi:nucleoside-diphosphate-sugar epimerase
VFHQIRHHYYLFSLMTNHRRLSILTTYWAVVVLSLLLTAFDASSSSSSSSLIAAMATTTSPTVLPKKECAVIGVGVLGTSLCRQLLENNWKVTGITKTSSRHDEIRQQVGADIIGQEKEDRFTLQTAEDTLYRKKYPYCVFCAPPSGFDDYASAVEEAMTQWWDQQGIFVFTSSGGIYGPGDSSGIATVNEESPLPDPGDNNPRSARLLGAETAVLGQGGTVLRLAGLYTLDRGAHNFWLGKEEVGGRADGIINLLHYDDAAGSVVAALQVEDVATVKGKTFLISDGHPLTRQQICESTVKSSKYSGMRIPTFTGPESDPMGKIYDGSVTNAALKWKPRYPSFDEFMAASQH